MTEQGNDDNKSYTVDTAEQTCTCPGWDKSRALYPKDNLVRLCKHLIDAYVENPDLLPEALKDQDNMRRIQWAAAGGKGFPFVREFVRVELSSPETICELFLPAKKDSPWIPAWVDGEEFGYNLEEDRWGFDKTPVDAETIIEAMKKHNQ